MKYLLIILLTMTLFGCGCPFAKESKVNHVVLCWFNEPGNKEHRADMIAKCQKFKDIPGVISVRVGETLASDVPVVDTSFDVAIYLSYASAEDLKKYINHPIHQKVLKENIKPYLKKVVVYDFYSQ